MDSIKENKNNSVSVLGLGGSNKQLEFFTVSENRTNKTASVGKPAGAFVFRTIRIPHISFTGYLPEFDIRDLAHFLHVKFRFRNSRLYSASYNGLSKILGWSITKTMRYFKLFYKLGWAIKERGTVRLCRLNKIFFSKKVGDNKILKLRFNSLDTDEIKRTLYCGILMNKKRQVDRITDLKHDYSKNLEIGGGHKEERILTKRYGYDVSDSGKAVDKRFIINYRSLGKLFNVSTTRAYDIISDMVKNGKVFKHVRSRMIKENFSGRAFEASQQFFSKCYGAFYLDSKNRLWVQLPNEYIFPIR